MLNGLRFFARSVWYDIRKGLLARPLAIMACYGAFAGLAVYTERTVPAITAFVQQRSWLASLDAGAAQLILATIAGSMMTTVSVVFSVMIMALSLASIQFSPRILRNFMADGPTQNTLGVFVGTFLYCLLVLGTVHGGARGFVPAASVAGGMVLAAGALVWLIFFIHHIAEGINANHIVERIGDETIEIIDEEFPIAVGRADSHPEDTGPPPPPPLEAAAVEATASGYVQLINRERLVELATRHGVVIYQQHGIGEFAVEGNPLVSIVPPDRLTDELRRACLECFDLGAFRTMQQDVHYGIRQIVDVGLKATSAAVNDPTTANTCIDQLGRVLCHLARRRILPLEMRDPASGELRMVRRAVTFQGSVDLAFNQLRQYGRNDMAVCLRMVRALTEIALVTDHPPHQERTLHHARLIESAVGPQFPPEDRQELANRLRTLEAIVAAHRPKPRAIASADA
ncbi:MAG TPA: DUF2254 domain-containing protein [Polyangiaceae bacterium]